MKEYDYQRSLAILKSQVEKIENSVSAQDPFCQGLIHDLRYRSSHHNASHVHSTERGTYYPSSITSTTQYQNRRQQLQAYHYTSTHN